MIHLMLRKNIEQLEYDPAAQYRFHFSLTWFWFLSMPAIAFAFWPHSLAAMIQLLILEVSLWANFATHFGAMSSALAAKQTAPIKTERRIFPH